jgi:tetratricopeptide (TPR) repeat protein
VGIGGFLGAHKSRDRLPGGHKFRAMAAGGACIVGFVMCATGSGDAESLPWLPWVWICIVASGCDIETIVLSGARARLSCLALGILLVHGPCLYAQEAPAVTAKQLLAWVAGGMWSERLVQQVATRGIAFLPDEDYLQVLKSAGAPDSLLALLPKAKKSAGQTAPPPPSDPAFEHLATGAKALHEKNYDEAEKELAAALRLEPKNPDLVFALANVYELREEWDEAAQLRHQAVVLAPGFVAARLAMAYACYRLGDADCAEAESRAVLQRLPNDVEAHKNLGLALEASSDLEGAEREYREAIRLKPDYPNAFYDLGIVLSKKGDLEGSVAAYQQATRLNPTDWRYFYNLGIVLNDKGDHSASITAYKRAKELAPEEPTIRQNLGSEYCNTGQHAEAIMEMRELLELDPDWNMARDCLGKSLYLTRQDDAAMEVFREALRRDPYDGDAHIGVALGLINKKQYAEALAELQEAERLMPDSYLPHLDRGHVYFAQGRYDDASREYDQALRIAPANLEVVRRVARQYVTIGPPERTEELYRRAITLTKGQAGEMDPEAARLDGELAKYLTAHKEYDKAKPLYLDAIKILGQSGHPEDNGLQTVLDQYNAMLRAAGETGAPPGAGGAARGIPAAPGTPASSANLERNWNASMESAHRAMMANKFGEAERMYRQAVEDAEKLPPHDSRLMMTLRDLSGFYLRQGKYPQAEEPLKRALQISEKNYGEKSWQVADVLVDLAQLHVIQSDFKSAERLASRSLRLREQTPNTPPQSLVQGLDILANIYSADKQFDKAGPLYQRALALAEQTRGPEDISLTVCLDHLAGFYVNQGQLAKAEPLYRRALAIIEKKNGPNSPMLVGMLYSLASLMRKMGRTTEAEQIEKRWKEIQQIPR